MVVAAPSPTVYSADMLRTEEAEGGVLVNNSHCLVASSLVTGRFAESVILVCFTAAGASGCFALSVSSRDESQYPWQLCFYFTSVPITYMSL